MISMELFLRLTFELFDRMETIREIRDAGDCYYVSVNRSKNTPAFHMPYVVNKQGDIIGTMKSIDDLGEDAEFEKAKLVFPEE